MKKINKAALLGGAAAAAVAATVSMASPANAYTGNETYFLQLQDSHGYLVWESPKLYIRSAYGVCNRLNYTTGDYVVSELLAANPDRTYMDEFTFMVDAVTALCPWHDHSGGDARAVTA